MFVAEGFDVYTNPRHVYAAPTRVNIRDVRRRSSASATLPIAEASSAAATAGSARASPHPAPNRLVPPSSALQSRGKHAATSEHKQQKREKRKPHKHDMDASNKRRRTEDNGNGLHQHGRTEDNGNGLHQHDHDRPPGHHHDGNGSVQPPHAFSSAATTTTAASSSSSLSLETAVAAIPPAELSDIVLRHAAACEPLAADLRRAYQDRARRGESFEDYVQSIWKDINAAHRGQQGSRQRGLGGEDVYREVRDAVRAIGRRARPPAPFATRRNALVALRKIGKTVCLSGAADELGSRVVDLFQDGETSFVDTVEGIVEGLSEEEKAEVRAWTEKGETFEDKMFELVGLAEEKNVFDGLSVAAEKLGLVFEYGDSDENGHEDGHGQAYRERGAERRLDEDAGENFSTYEQDVRKALSGHDEGPGRPYLRIVNAIQRISAAVGPSASFATRRNALITLRRIADMLVLSTPDEALKHELREQTWHDHHMGPAVKQILGLMTGLEKKKLFESLDGDRKFGEKVVETTALAHGSGIRVGLEACLEALSLPPESRKGYASSEISGRTIRSQRAAAVSKAIQEVSSALSINWHSIRKSEYEQITAATSVYNRLIDLTTEIDRATKPPASFSTRRRALIKLLKIASMILRTVDRKSAAAYPIKGRFLDDDILGPTCRTIAYNMTTREKREVLRMKNGKGLTLEAELVKIVKLAERHKILLGMSNCLSQLRWQAW